METLPTTVMSSHVEDNISGASEIPAEIRRVVRLGDSNATPPPAAPPTTRRVFSVPSGQYSRADLREYREAMCGGEWYDKVDRLAAFYAKRDPDRLFDYSIGSGVEGGEDVEEGRVEGTVGDIYVYLALHDLGVTNMTPAQYRNKLHSLRCGGAGDDDKAESLLKRQVSELRENLKQ